MTLGIIISVLLLVSLVVLCVKFGIDEDWLSAAKVFSIASIIILLSWLSGYLIGGGMLIK